MENRLILQMNGQDSRGIVLITNGNYFARIILDTLFRNRNEEIRGVLIITGDYKARTGLRSLLEIGRVTALPYLIFKVVTILVFRLLQSLYPQFAFSVAKLADSYSIPVKSVVAVNSDEALDWVAECKADLIVSVSCPQMIKEKMLSLPRLGGINIHSSLLPSYAGLAPYFWVLAEGDKNTGTTVHYMTLKFDQGNILSQGHLVIEPRESAFNLFRRLAVLGSSCLEEAVLKALDSCPGEKQDLFRYSYYSNPSLSGYQKLREHGHTLIRFKDLKIAKDCVMQSWGH